MIATIPPLAHGEEAAVAPACSLQRVAELDMLPSDSEAVLIPVQLDGRPGKLAIDTGGFWSVLSRSSIGDLRPRRSEIYRIQGLGGSLDQYVTLRSFAIDRFEIRNLDFYVGPEHAFADADGTLGINVLQKFDIEIDPGRNKVNLFSQKHCKGQVLYWPQTDAVRIPFEIRYDAITIPVILDGKPVRAMIDTGAEYSLLSAPVASEVFKLNAADLGAPMPVVGLDGNEAMAYEHQFKTLQIGDIVFSNPWVAIKAVDERPDDNKRMSETGFTMLIGMHQLRMLHLYIAYGEKAIYASTVRGDALARAKNTPSNPETLESPATSTVHRREVVLSFMVRADGSVGEVTVIRGTGSDEQDQDAVEWVRHQTYPPATKNGKPFDSKRRITLFKDS